jgi:hypothetical protein
MLDKLVEAATDALSQDDSEEIGKLPSDVRAAYDFPDCPEAVEVREKRKAKIIHDLTHHWRSLVGMLTVRGAAWAGVTTVAFQHTENLGLPTAAAAIAHLLSSVAYHGARLESAELELRLIAFLGRRQKR